MGLLSQEITVIVLASIFLILLMVSIIILFLIYQKRQLKYLMEKKELNDQFQRELLKTRLETHEETLNQLGQDLHDNLGQLLSSSRLLIGVVERSLPAPLEELRITDQTIAKALQELRAMSKSLSREWLEQFNLIENLDSEITRLNASRAISITLKHPDFIDLAADRQIMVFRIVQEAIQNSIKHGQAKHIRITLESIESDMRITIRDDGKGFDIQDTSLHGVGILNIRNRTKLLGGSAQWYSHTVETTVVIEIPLSTKRNEN